MMPMESTSGGAAGATLRWLFVGQGEMGAAALEGVLAGLGGVGPPVGVLTGEPPLGMPPVATVAREHGLMLAHTDRVGDAPGERWPELFTDVDVVLCCCWTERLPPAALALPACGWLNLHPSALPAWRGADPVGWQLLTAPSQIGCSIHRMTEGHDDGPVVAQDRVPVTDGDDRGAVSRRSGTQMGHLAGQVLADLAAGVPLDERPQQAQEVTWCPPPGTVPMVDPRDLRAASGARVARAFSPQPGVGVATLPGDQRFALTHTGGELTGGHAPGELVVADDGTAAIAFTDRWLHGHAWRVAAERPGRTQLAPPGASRLPRGRP